MAVVVRCSKEIGLSLARKLALSRPEKKEKNERSGALRKASTLSDFYTARLYRKSKYGNDRDGDGVE